MRSSIQEPMARSHGQRSSSVSGWPAAILATLASEWNSSPSAKSQPIAVAMPLATVVLPDPGHPHDDDHVTTCHVGTSRSSLFSCAAANRQR